MKIIIQKVKHASVTIENKIYSQIDLGYCIFLGIDAKDTKDSADRLIQKILKIKLFEGEGTYFANDIKEVNGQILIVSQFTLSGKFNGSKPSFTDAMQPKEAKDIYNYFVEKIRDEFSKVETGTFGAHMVVSIENDGPVTFIIEG